MGAADRELFQQVLARDSGLQMTVEYERRTRNGFIDKIARALRPPLPVYTNPKAPPLPQPRGEVSLWLGGGGLQLPGFVNIDVAPTAGVDLLSNASRLPFQADCCDSIACLALLEHVPDPEQIVSEMLRVLKPGGDIQAVVPFCHPYHGYPRDFVRFSRDGLTNLFAGYDHVEIGIRTGPTTSLLTFLTYYAKLFFPVHGGTPLRRNLNRLTVGAFGWAIAPFRYLDIALNQWPGAEILANHFYVTARKPLRQP
jgi:SAM-dependent methyltransferase